MVFDCFLSSIRWQCLVAFFGAQVCLDVCRSLADVDVSLLEAELLYGGGVYVG